MESRKVLIVGAGQLGSRYLQGLATCEIPLEIYVYDIYANSLDTAKLRWLECCNKKTLHVAYFITSLDVIPKTIDVAIVSTTSASRVKVMQEVTHQTKVKYWVIEKVLAQSEEELDELAKIVKPSVSAWVNTPRRMLAWYEEIRLNLDPLTLEKLVVTGYGWGMACNAVHFLDAFSWLSGQVLISASTNGLSPVWLQSKRSGYWEVFGTLDFRFSSGGEVSLSAAEGPCSYAIKLIETNFSWAIDEEFGTANRSDGKIVLGKIPLQSEMTAKLIQSILQKGSCGLPLLQDSILTHKVFLGALLDHWRHHKEPSANRVPIT